MATLTTLAADVYTLTNRPDLVSETNVAIRKAIYKFHGADTFKRDIKTFRLQMSLYTPLAPDDYRWQIPLTTFPQFRRPKYLTTPLTSTAIVTVFYEVAADRLFDTYRCEYLNYFFIAGSTLVIKSVQSPDYLDLTYYAYPIVPSVTTDTITSWIADQYPDAIIEEAAGTVFKMIGKDDEYSRYQTLFAENIQILRQTDVGEGN